MSLPTPMDELIARVHELENAIRYVVTQTADDICWMDAYSKLGEQVGIKFDPTLIDPAIMRKNCDRYIDSIYSGCVYSTDRITKDIRERKETLEMFQTFGYGVGDQSG